MKQKIEQRQIQKLILTQSLKQSIELLQYSQLELQEKLEEEAKENPFIKIKKKEFIPIGIFEGYVDYEATERKHKAIENVAAKTQSLYTILEEQIEYLNLSDKEREAARILISSLDKNGFLSQDPEKLLKPLGFSSEEIYELRKKIASLEPYGCCALNYIESLLFQLELKQDISEAKDANFLLQNFQKELEDKDFEAIKKKTGFDDKKIQRILSLLRTLNPFPGLPYSNEETIYIEPDVYVFVEEIHLNGDKDYKIEVILNDKTLQNIEFNKEYIKQVQQEKQLSKKELEELKKKYYNAQTLIHAIQQRNETLLKVAKSIVKFQREFFITGKNLQPLKLKDIAEDVGLHESTVSRITTNKYVYTRWGIFELKYFFRRGLKSINKENAVTTDKVKELIKEIINNEDKTIPLKDQEIADILIKKGIKIARRTVAKYRKELGIPSVSERKKI
ncbi:MAG: RNA polymerase sigma-54 factor [Leptospiraceae bacterium]|nr:MAG: RNA polymerase sigma-54 factor [Leptospiraceae bacterium]